MPESSMGRTFLILLIVAAVSIVIYFVLMAPDERGVLGSAAPLIPGTQLGPLESSP